MTAAMVAFALLPASHASAASGQTGFCVQTQKGVTSVAAGSPATARPYTSVGSSDDYFCKMPDPTIHSAKESWSQSGGFQCVPPIVTATGTDTFHWDNGQTSVLRYQDKIIGGADFTEGTIVEGEFLGMHSRWTGTGLGPFTDNVGTLLATTQVCAGQAVKDAPAGYTGVAYLSY